MGKNKKSPNKCCPLLDTLLSGSPIVQNGRLVGAVTHVLVGDPTQGYGILAQRMLETGEKCKISEDVE